MKHTYISLFVLIIFCVTFITGFVFQHYIASSVEAQSDQQEEDLEDDQNTDEKTEGEESQSDDSSIGDEEIEELKNKIESKVEELTDSQYGTAGFVQKMKEESIMLNTRTEEIEVFIDEDITEIYAIENGSRQDRDFEDLEITDYITVIGPQLEGVINANEILFDSSYTVRSGKILEVNEDDFYVSVLMLDKTTYILDIEEETSSEMYNIKNKVLESIGFSKLKEGDTIHFTAQAGWREDQDRFSVSSLVIIPQEYFLR